MTKVMSGIRVLEVAQFTFVPAAGGVMTDWGADVIKIEHPVRGDAQRGIQMLQRLAVNPQRSSAETEMTQQIEEGKALFDLTCSSCHGLGAEGTSQGPTLIGVGAASVDFQMGLLAHARINHLKPLNGEHL